MNTEKCFNSLYRQLVEMLGRKPTLVPERGLAQGARQ